MKYLIVKCEPLSDGWECDANRIPLCVIDNLNEYKGKWGYEIYEIRSDGRLILVQDWE